MKLAQILIEAGVTPADLHPDCKFIAQDGDDGMCWEFKKSPSQIDGLKAWWKFNTTTNGSNLELSYKISKDWQTPLSRADFIAAYEEYLNGK